MRRLLLLLTVFAALVSPVSSAYDTTSNLVYTTVNPPPDGWEGNTWSGFTNNVTNGQGFSGGNQPNYNPVTGTFMFGYSEGTVAYTHALSQALRNSGLNIIGYNYAWEYLNYGMSRGTLSAAVSFTSTNNATLHNRTWSLGATGETWQSVTGTETFANSLLAANIASFTLSFTGRDDRFWAGYYGPQVRNPSISLNYEFDPCVSNPLSSPSCPGYEAAYQTQQCSMNALYSPACPGYAVAYLNLQCSLNPLYSTTCAGYAQAYFNQQCQSDGLYSKDCPNYNEAYTKKNILNKTETIVLAQVDTSAAVPLVSDPVVNRTITTQGTTANAEANPAAPVKLAAPSNSNSTTQDTTQTKSETRATTVTTDSASGNKPKTTREALAEKQREKAKAEAVARGKELANTMGKAADMQAQMEVQNVVIQAMGFTPGFDNYGRFILPDGTEYKPYSIYNNQRNVDTPSSRGLFGGSDTVHQQMVDSQYNLGK